MSLYSTHYYNVHNIYSHLSQYNIKCSKLRNCITSAYLEVGPNLAISYGVQPLISLAVSSFLLLDDLNRSHTSSLHSGREGGREKGAERG